MTNSSVVCIRCSVLLCLIYPTKAIDFIFLVSFIFLADSKNTSIRWNIVYYFRISYYLAVLKCFGNTAWNISNCFPFLIAGKNKMSNQLIKTPKTLKSSWNLSIFYKLGGITVFLGCLN